MMNKSEIRIIIVDEFRIFTECLEVILINDTEISVLKSIADPHDAINEARAFNPDILLISVNFLDNKAFELTKQMRQELPQVKVIVFNLTGEEPKVLKYIEAGAAGYLTSKASMQDLIETIRLVYNGESICSPKIAYSIFSRVAELAQRRPRKIENGQDSLTVREMEILYLISKGLSNGKIALQLYLSLSTVKNHVHNILEKLQVKSRTEAIHYALDKRLFLRKDITQ